MAFDYRFTSFLETAKSSRDAHKTTADRERKNRDSDNGANEVRIARAEGAMEAFGWICDQLKLLEAEFPQQPGAKPPKDAKSKDGANVRSARHYAVLAQNVCKEAMHNGRNYGWSEAKYSLQNALDYLENVLVFLPEQ